MNQNQPGQKATARNDESLPVGAECFIIHSVNASRGTSRLFVSAQELPHRRIAEDGFVQERWGKAIIKSLLPKTGECVILSV